MVPPNKEQHERLEECLKFADNLHYEGAHHVDSVDYWDQGASRLWAGDRGCTGIGEAYSGREIACHVHISLDCGWDNLYTQNLCARFEKLSVAHITKVDGVCCFAEDLDRVDARPKGYCQCGDYYSVLVVVRETLEPGEGVDGETAVSVPSLVKLIFLDDRPMFGGDVEQDVILGKIFGRRAGGRALISKGKLDFLGVSGLTSPAVEAGELPDEMIQGSPEVVDRVSHNKTPTTKPFVRKHCFSPKDMVSALVVEMQAQTYSIAWRYGSTCPANGSDLSLKGTAVLFGSVNLGPTSTEVGLVTHDW